MQYSIVNYKDINTNLYRLDAEYHVGISKIDMSRLIGYKLSDLCKKVVQGPNPKFIDEGIPSLNGKNVYFGTLDADVPNYISKEEYKSFRPYHLNVNDILITLKHASRVGRLWIFQEEKECLFSRNLGLIRLDTNTHINVETLLFYLWGRIPQTLLNLIATGGTNGQITLSMAELREFPIPKLSDDLQILLKITFLSGDKLIGQSKKLYHQAENLLLSELGLLDWRPEHCLSFVRNYFDTEQVGRFDAEYFQPKYDEIVKAVKDYKGRWETLGNLLNIKDKNFNPVDNKEYRYIELANIGGNGEVAGHTTAEGQELPTRARRKVCANDVIVSSIEGSLSSIALITRECDNALCSTGFYVVNSDDINSETLLVLLKSQVGQLQLKKGCSGTILTAINKDEFGRIVLPVVNKKIQSKIQQKIVESFALRKQSKHLLECAKKSVEMAIEKDEKTALQWLKKETKTN